MKTWMESTGKACTWSTGKVWIEAIGKMGTEVTGKAWIGSFVKTWIESIGKVGIGVTGKAWIEKGKAWIPAAWGASVEVLHICSDPCSDVRAEATITHVFLQMVQTMLW